MGVIETTRNAAKAFENAVELPVGRILDGDCVEAMRRLPGFVAEYLEGGAEDERTLNANRTAFASPPIRRSQVVVSACSGDWPRRGVGAADVRR